MFDLAWTEIALIAVVAMVIIGPKDLPEAIRGVAKGIQKLRRMAAEFQTHADELVREAKLEEVRDQINQVRNFDIKGELERAVDRDGSIRKTFEEDPLRETYGPAAPPQAAAPAAEAAAGGVTTAEATPPPSAAPEEPPPFIPPEAVRTAEPAPAPVAAEPAPDRPANPNA